MPNPAAPAGAVPPVDAGSTDPAETGNDTDLGSGRGEETVPYSRLAGVVAQRQKLKQENEAMRLELEARRKKELEAQGQHEQIAREATERATKAEAAAKAALDASERQRKLFAVSIEAVSHGALSADDVTRFVNADTLVIENDQVIGAKEAVEALKKEKPYLFGTTGTAPAAPAPRVAQSRPSTPGSTPITRDELLKDIGLMKKLHKENPQEYNRIMGRQGR